MATPNFYLDASANVPVWREETPAPAETVERRLAAQEKRIGALMLERDGTNQLLTAILAELQHLNSTERTGAVSSCEVKFLANGTPQPTVKAYVGSEVPVDEAIEAYGRTVLMATQAAAEGWEQTVEVLQREREVAANG